MNDLHDFVMKLKETNPIEEVAEALGLKFERGAGRYRRVAKSGGLVVNVGKQSFFHATAGTRGDVIELVRVTKGYEPKTAMEWLARRSNVEIPNWGRMSDDELKSHRMTVNVFEIAQRLFQEWLWEDEEALDYMRTKRAFSDEVIAGDVTAEDVLKKDAPFRFSKKTLEAAQKAVKAGRKDQIVVAGAGFGFSGRRTENQLKEMKGEFDMFGIAHDHPTAVTILGFMGDVTTWTAKWNIDRKSRDWDSTWEEKGRLHGMMITPGIVYAHRFAGQTTYLSRRNMPGHDDNGHWKSFNPQKIIVGNRQPYFNHVYRYDAEECVICEGPLDAESWGVWGVAAVALCGVNADDDGMTSLKSRLKRHKKLMVALDRDETGDSKRERVAESFGPLTRLVDYASLDADPLEVEEEESENIEASNERSEKN